MPQQINLCTAVLVTKKQYLSARTLMAAVGILVLVGGALSAGWSWKVQQAAGVLQKTLSEQTKEIDGLKLAIQASRASAAPVDAALQQQLQEKHAALERRENLLAALKNGLLIPGMGHSDRLQLLANSIPGSAWITEVQAEASSLRVAGFTMDPASLNQWVEKLSVSPLMKGLKLSAVQVENTVITTAKRPVSVSSEPNAVNKPVWAFDIVSAAPEPVKANTTTAGGKP